MAEAHPECPSFAKAHAVLAISWLRVSGFGLRVWV